MLQCHSNDLQRNVPFISLYFLDKSLQRNTPRTYVCRKNYQLLILYHLLFIYAISKLQFYKICARQGQL